MALQIIAILICISYDVKCCHKNPINIIHLKVPLFDAFNVSIGGDRHKREQI